MHQYDKALSYIDYFSSAGEEAGTWVYKPHVFPYVHYSLEMISFIDEVYKTHLIDIEYLSYMESHITKESNLSDYIENADFRLLRVILTYYVRQERFYDGLLQGAVIDKTIYRILLKLSDTKTPKWAKFEYDCET
jgi:hypothetical protein